MTLRTSVLAVSAVLLATLASAQVLKKPHDDSQNPDQNQTKINAKTPKNYPRAIAVIEFLPGGGTRLVPVALWINDRFYDASLYGANPEPMAVQPETVYQATDYGEPVGLFTVTSPEELKGTWIASGQWNPRKPLDEKLAQQAAKQAKSKPADSFDSDRPVLRRPGSSDSSSSSSGTGTAQTSSGSATPAAAENDPNRPTLKKPAESTDTSSSPATSPSQTAQAANSPASPASSETADNADPNRPMLKRGKLTAQPSAPEPIKTTASMPNPTPPSAQGEMPANVIPVVRHSYPAVSDAGQHETRSLLYAMNPEERAAKSEQMSALALDEVRKFIAQRHTPALPKAVAITDFDLRAYDLEFRNSPTLVFTGRIAVPGAKAFRSPEFDYFVTFVAHEDLNGEPIKIFSSVTDSNHLDAFARMEIIDAVDADANGRGDLLFRQYSDTGISYSLYRVFPYDMEKVFEGGSGA